MKQRAHRLGVLAAALMLAAPLAAADDSAAIGSDPTLYRPIDADERGLWMQMDEAERGMRTSPMVIRDPALNTYVRGVLCKITGEDRCRNIRLYIVRTADFNASMAPNGMLEVWSGLLLRCQNEAQLAAVLGHEYTHFEQRHTLRLFRNARENSNAAGWFAIIPFGGLISLGLLSGVFEFSRDMEHDADTGGLEKMARAGYDTREAAAIWERLRAEMDATAAARGTKSRKDKDRGIFQTHPPSAERVAYLRQLALKLPGVPGATGLAAYRQALAPYWPMFLDDQLKRNDLGAGEFLLANMAGPDAGGWTPWLLYARGELYRRRAAPGDLEKASGYYSDAIRQGGDVPELWRGRGLAELKLEQPAAGKADLAEYLRRAPGASDYAMMAMMAGGNP